MNKWPPIAASVVVIFSILACNVSESDVISAATAFSQTQTAQASVPASPAPGDTAAAPSPTFTATTAPLPPTACSPIVTANITANVRAGDSTDYDIIGGLTSGASAPLMGRNAADTWWYITYGGGHGWIAKSVATASCVPASVAVVVPPPLPPTPTNVPAPAEFAVTGVSYSFYEADYGGHANCPAVTAHITANGPGDVTYVWRRSDNATGPTNSLHFGSAGTKDVSTNWALGSVWEGTEFWLGIYVDAPNHQEFGHQTFTDACDG